MKNGSKHNHRTRGFFPADGLISGKEVLWRTKVTWERARSKEQIEYRINEIVDATSRLYENHRSFPSFDAATEFLFAQTALAIGAYPMMDLMTKQKGPMDTAGMGSLVPTLRVQKDTKGHGLCTQTRAHPSVSKLFSVPSAPPW